MAITDLPAAVKELYTDVSMCTLVPVSMIVKRRVCFAIDITGFLFSFFGPVRGSMTVTDSKLIYYNRTKAQAGEKLPSM